MFCFILIENNKKKHEICTPVNPNEMFTFKIKNQRRFVESVQYLSIVKEFKKCVMFFKD